MNSRSGKIIALIGFLGGAAIIRSMMRAEINMGYLLMGCLLLVVALLLFIRQVRNI